MIPVSVGEILNLLKVANSVATDLKSYGARMSDWNKDISTLNTATEKMRNSGLTSDAITEWLAGSDDLFRRIEVFMAGQKPADALRRRFHEWNARVHWNAAGAADLRRQVGEHRLAGFLIITVEQAEEKQQMRTPVGEICLPKSMSRRFPEEREGAGM